MGNITGLTTYWYAPKVNTETQSFGYDELDRLVTAAGNGHAGAGIPAYSHSYGYDEMGNITNFAGESFTYEDSDHTHAVTHVDSAQRFTYDANGNMTGIDPPGASGTVRHGYDQRNLMITSTVDGSAVASFSYDGMNNRLRQVDFTGATAITTTYANDILGLSQVLIADDGTDQVVNLFGLDLILQADGTGALALLADGLGSVRLEMVGDGVETTTTYSPYGKELAQEGDSATTYGFTGEQEDDSTGLLYLRARYYSSGLMAFTGRDPWAGDIWRPSTLQSFTYVLNNPVRYTDPRGLCDPYCPPTPPPPSGTPSPPGSPPPGGTPSPPGAQPPSQPTPVPVPAPVPYYTTANALPTTIFPGIWPCRSLGGGYRNHQYVQLDWVFHNPGAMVEVPVPGAGPSSTPQNPTTGCVDIVNPDGQFWEVTTPGQAAAKRVQIRRYLGRITSFGHPLIFGVPRPPYTIDLAPFARPGRELLVSSNGDPAMLYYQEHQRQQQQIPEEVLVLIGAGVTIYLVCNNVTGVGVLDDPLIPVALSLIISGTSP